MHTFTCTVNGCAVFVCDTDQLCVPGSRTRSKAGCCVGGLPGCWLTLFTLCSLTFHGYMTRYVFVTSDDSSDRQHACHCCVLMACRTACECM
jgi:hypothetical protein